jgi:hypothetical protein
MMRPVPKAALARIEVDDAVVGRTGLTTRMRAATYAVAETLFTTREGPPPAARLEWLCDDLDHFFVHAGSRARFAYRLCLLGISAIAPLLVWRLPPFRTLSRAQRTRALERLERSGLGLAVFGAKAALCILYYEHPDAARAIGFDASCSEDPQ